MSIYKNRIVFTGGSGSFAQSFKSIEKKTKLNFFFPKKNKLNILNYKSVIKYLKLKKPKYLIHLAGLSRPMNIHDRDICQSIDKNIIGSSSITKACSKLNIKLIYISTCYVYPGTKGNYSEDSAVKPINKYAWSKLGGECAVMLYKNSLILRICMTEKPFMYKYAYTNLKTNFMFHEDLAKVFFKLINKKGVINIGGPAQSVHNFAKKYNKKIRKKVLKKTKNCLPLNSTMSVVKFRKIL